jgi:hypothetical protein
MRRRPIATFLLIVPLLLAPAVAMAAPAGRVLLAAGEVIAIRDGRALRLAVGSAVEPRDLLRTGLDGHLQVRLSDESLIALKPGSALSLERYRFDGRADGTENAFFRLVKGGFRTVTGLIGRANRDAYRVNAGVATIGIRGTAYALALCEGGGCIDAGGRPAPDGLYGTVTDGQIAANNRAGGGTFGIGESFFTRGQDAPFQRLLAPPAFLAARLEGLRRAAAGQSGRGEDTASDPSAPTTGRTDRTDTDAPLTQVAGTTTTGTDPLAGSLTTAASNLLNDDGRIDILPPADGFVIATTAIAGNPLLRFGDRVEGLFDGGNRLTGFEFTDYYGTLQARGTIGGGSFADLGRAAVGDVVVTWGRWDGGVIQLGSGQIVQNTPLLFGTANGVSGNTAGSANLGLVGTVQYAFVGGPGPIALGGPAGTAYAGGSMLTKDLTIDFTQGTAFLDMELRLNYRSLGTTSVSTQVLTLTGSLSATSAGIRNSGDFSGSPGVTCAGPCGTGGYTSTVQMGVGGPKGYDIAVVAGNVSNSDGSLSASFLGLHGAKAPTSANLIGQ